MVKATRWIIFFLLVMGLASLACQTVMGPNEPEASNDNSTTAQTTTEDTTTSDNAGDAAANDNAASASSGDATPAESGTSATPEQPASTDSGAAAAGGERAFNFRRSNAALDEINSYRATMSISSDVPGNPADSFSMAFEILVTTNPQASSLRFTTFEFGDGEDEFGSDFFGGMSIVEMDGKSYTDIASFGCTVSDSTEESMAEEFVLRPDGLFDDLDSDKVTLVERGVTINGIVTDHYRFDETAIEDSDANVTNMIGDIYVAQQGDFIVRMVIVGEGDLGGLDDGSSSGTMRVEFNVYDVNSNITITIPDACLNVGSGTGGSSTYPMLADAYDQTSFAGFITYKTNSSVSDAAAFYRRELTNQGWQITFEFSDNSSATFMLEKDGKSLTVAIVADTTSGGTLVSIIES